MSAEILVRMDKQRMNTKPACPLAPLQTCLPVLNPPHHHLHQGCALLHVAPANLLLKRVTYTAPSPRSAAPWALTGRAVMLHGTGSPRSAVAPADLRTAFC